MAHAGFACQAFAQVFHIWMGFTGSLDRKAFSFFIFEKLCWMEIMPVSKEGRREQATIPEVLVSVQAKLEVTSR